MKRPEDPKQEEWVLKEIDNYTRMVGYMAFFIQQRGSFGDGHGGPEIFEEFKANVCEVIRAGTASPAGEQ